MARLWSDEPRRFTIDLDGAGTPDRLRAALAEHFELPAEWPDVWLRIAQIISGQERPYHIQFVNWEAFQRAMPRYARRLKRLLDEYVRWHPHALLVRYSTEPPAPAIDSIAPTRALALRQLLAAASPPSMQDSVILQPSRAAESPPSARGSVVLRLRYIVLKPIARPTVAQIMAFRELSLVGRGLNMLQIRRVLVQGGHTCFGELLPERAERISARLSAADVPHSIEETAPRRVILPAEDPRGRESF
jgi:hypothetical protein